MNIHRLMIFNAPERDHAFLFRHKFRPTEANPRHWWRTFDVRPELIERQRLLARQVVALLRERGLEPRWSVVEYKPHPEPTIDYRGAIDFAVHNVHNSSWRRKARRRK